MSHLSFTSVADNRVATQQLWIALRAPDVVQVEQALAAGADSNSTNAQQVPALQFAVRIRALDVVRLLLDAGADLMRATGNLQQSPLHVCGFFGSLEVAELLVQRGADINSRDRRRQTPLLLAIEHNNLDVARYFLAHGADLELTGENDYSPLRLAVRLRRNSIIPDLLAAGAHSDARDNDGLTALHLAAIGDQGNVAALLLRAGANPDLCDHAGKDLLAYCARGEAKTVAAALLAYRARCAIQRELATSQDLETVERVI